MNKKGQIFITIAIIVIIFVYIGLKTYNIMTIDKGQEEYTYLKENYNTELTYVKNKCIADGKDPDVCAQKFTDVFLELYAKKIDPNFGIITIYRDSEGNIIIRNSMMAGNWITVQSDVEDVAINIPSQYNEVKGDIEIEGLGLLSHTKVSAPLSVWGEEISAIEMSSEELKDLKICIPSYGENACFEFDDINLENMDSFNIIASQACSPEELEKDKKCPDDKMDQFNICTDEEFVKICTQTTSLNSL